MIRYERITYAPKPRKVKTQLVRVIGETDRLLHVKMVDQYGDDVGDRIDKDGAVQIKEHIIDKGLLARRVPMRMNMTYAELEVDE
jgi:hypothetical protein